MGWYITIQQEMRDVLGLKGNELLVFAFINGYSQEGQGCYYGSLAHLQEVCGIASRQTAIAVLKSLCEKGYIIKNEQLHPVKMVSYSVCPKIGQGVQKLDMGCPKIGHNNKGININKERDNNGRTRFVKPSISEVAEFCLERNNGIDPEEFVAFYESKGWMVGKNPMKDWKSAIITWEKSKKREKETPQRKRATRQESVFEHNLKVMDEMFGTKLHEQAYGGQADEQ